jgi:hypothetical protein
VPVDEEYAVVALRIPTGNRGRAATAPLAGCAAEFTGSGVSPCSGSARGEPASFNTLGEPAFAAWCRALHSCRQLFPERLQCRGCGGNTTSIGTADIPGGAALSASLLSIRMW